MASWVPKISPPFLLSPAQDKQDGVAPRKVDIKGENAPWEPVALMSPLVHPGLPTSSSVSPLPAVDSQVPKHRNVDAIPKA